MQSKLLRVLQEKRYERVSAALLVGLQPTANFIPIHFGHADIQQDEVGSFGCYGFQRQGPVGAAELLGVNPTTFLARMKKWNITRPAGA